MAFLVNHPTTVGSSCYKKLVQHEILTAQELRDCCSIGVFTFRTVMHRTILDMGLQPACDCAHRHEHLAHISKTGAINQEELSEICTWIDNGRCPHVVLADVARLEVRETSVSILAVAVAANNKRLYPQFLGHFTGLRNDNPVLYRNSGLNAAIRKRSYLYFKRCSETMQIPVAVAVSRTRCNNLIEVVDSTTPDGFKNIVDTDPARYCVDNNDMRLLKVILNPNMPVQKAIEDSVFADKREFTEVLLTHYLELCRDRQVHRNIHFVQNLAVIAILKKNYEVLKKLDDSGMLCQHNHWHCSKMYSIHDIALLFEETRCASILFRDLKPSRTRQTINPYQVVVDASRVQRDPTQCIALLRLLRERGFDINQTDERGNTALMTLSGTKLFRIVTSCTSVDFVHPDVFGTLLELGCDVNKANCDGIKPLMHCLNTRAGKEFVHRTAIVRLCLYHNAVMEPGKERSYAEWALKVDMQPFNAPRISRFPPRVGFQWLVHDVPFTDLVTPLLWECGLEWNTDMMDRTTTPDDLWEFMYQKKRQPRSLQMMCRNTLRRRYPGRFKLLAYLRRAGSPKNLNDYVLMNDVLNINA